MRVTLWFVVGGALLVVMALAESKLRRLPLTTALLYLVVGFVLGPVGIGLFAPDPIDDAELLERAAEVVVVISLFSAGLKLRTPLTDPLWWVPVRLAFLSMTLTVGGITLVGWLLLGLPLGGAVLLGAVLAPTDPVLASDVQVKESTDRDRLRFGLTGEAGLNDGVAFPFVMLGLGLLGLHELGAGGWRWFAVDLVWAIVGGLGLGALLGTVVGRLVIHLRREHREAVGVDDFLALGLIALSYGVALLISAYGFLAVFAAGLALRRIERQSSGDQKPPPEVEVAAAGEDEAVATDEETAPAYMAQAVLGFSEQLERIGTVAVVIVIGGMLFPSWVPADAVWLIPLLFLVIRPLAVLAGLIGAPPTGTQRAYMSWFGVRGIGSLYYLMYAVRHGVPDPLAARLIGITVAVIAASILAHGVSVTPLMNLYRRRTGRDASAGAES